MAANERSETLLRPTDGARLDPFSLPQRFRYDTGIDPRTGLPMGEAAVVIDRNQAMVCRRLPSGIPMAMRLPMAAFEGVAVRIATDGPDDDHVVVELLHHDPHLSLPLSVADDVADVVADWKAWSRVLGLPMVLVEVDGSRRMLEERLGSLKIAAVRPRRRRSVLAGRRPRFLTRRKTGCPAATPVIHHGREIFGRD